MKFIRFLLFGFSALLLCSCGTTVYQSLKVQPGGKHLTVFDKTVVILPFSDYSSTNNLETTYKRNLFVSENLIDQFNKYGFHIPVQDDVFLYLVEHNFINVISYNGEKTNKLEYEMKQEWSHAMKTHLQRYINLSKKNSASSDAVDRPGTRGLTQQEIVKIGQKFSADYVIRGRILQFKERQDPALNPFQKGLIPFVTGVTNKVAFGQAESEKYDVLNETLAGASDAAAISALTDGYLNHAVGWGVAGAVLGNMAHHSGKVPQSVVQLRIWVQDASTGQVVWTNRVDVKVSPKSVLADYQHDVLFEEATERAISTLVGDFVRATYRPTTLLSSVSVDTDKDGVSDLNDHCPDTPVGVPVNMFGCSFKQPHFSTGVR